MPQLNRSLGIVMLTFYGIGMILGAGIYTIIGKAAGHTQETLWLGFVIAGIAVFLTALSYAELSTMYPKAGAEYIYLTKAFAKKKWLASTIGVAVAFSGAATAAAVSIAFSGYLSQFVQIPQFIVASSLLVLFSCIAILGIRTSAWTNIIFTLIEIGGLALIIYLGFRTENFGESLSVTPHIGTLSGAALIIFSYFGFENIANLTEEAKDPKKDIPRAMLISLGISTGLYILVSIAVIALTSAESLAESDAPLMLAAQKGSAKAKSIMGIVALFSTANTALISVIGASRMLYGMAGTHALPQILAQVLPSKKTPWVATLVICTAALLLLPLGQIEIVGSISSMTTMIAFLGVNVAMISLRYSDPKKERPFRVPLSIGKLPVLAVLASLCSLVFLLQFQTKVYLIGGTFLVLMMLFFIWRQKLTSRKSNFKAAHLSDLRKSGP